MKKINDTGGRGPVKLSKANTCALTPIGFNLLQLRSDVTTDGKMTDLPDTATATKPNKTSSLCESLLAQTTKVRRQER